MGSLLVIVPKYTNEACLYVFILYKKIAKNIIKKHYFKISRTGLSRQFSSLVSAGGSHRTCVRLVISSGVLAAFTGEEYFEKPYLSGTERGISIGALLRTW